MNVEEKKKKKGDSQSSSKYRLFFFVPLQNRRVYSVGFLPARRGLRAPRTQL